MEFKQIGSIETSRTYKVMEPLSSTSPCRDSGMRDRSALVWRGACDDLFTPQPLGPFVEIAARSQSGLSALLQSGAGRLTVSGALLSALQQSPTAVILVIEDLHWADEATLDVLKFLGRRIQNTRTLLILSYRDDEVSGNHPLRFLLGDLPASLTSRIRLPVLSVGAVERLASQFHWRPEGLCGLYPPGLQWYWNADFVTELSDKAIDLHLQYAEQLPSVHSTMHLYPINGAAQRVGANDTAWSFREANFAQVIVGVDPDPANNARTIAWSKEYWRKLHPHSAGGAYVNMMMDEGQERVMAAYRDNYPRLVQVKAKYDPQPVPDQSEHQAGLRAAASRLSGRLTSFLETLIQTPNTTPRKKPVHRILYHPAEHTFPAPCRHPLPRSHYTRRQ